MQPYAEEEAFVVKAEQNPWQYRAPRLIAERLIQGDSKLDTLSIETKLDQREKFDYLINELRDRGLIEGVGYSTNSPCTEIISLTDLGRKYYNQLPKSL